VTAARHGARRDGRCNGSRPASVPRSTARVAGRELIRGHGDHRAQRVLDARDALPRLHRRRICRSQRVSAGGRAVVAAVATRSRCVCALGQIAAEDSVTSRCLARRSGRPSMPCRSACRRPSGGPRHRPRARPLARRQARATGRTGHGTCQPDTVPGRSQRCAATVAVDRQGRTHVPVPFEPVGLADFLGCVTATLTSVPARSPSSARGSRARLGVAICGGVGRR
jgi:hypothetical protein